ncbi:MAG: 23S rRNA (uracil1939-C5)-methyltransferase, partial [Candidatus Azotimanducaceae bacterium]
VPQINELERFNKVLLDPPRSGAEALVKMLASANVERVVYVSCNPDTLARDVKILVEQGYRLQSAGIIDMFPHTTHVESVALLTRHAHNTYGSSD